MRDPDDEIEEIPGSTPIYAQAKPQVLPQYPSSHGKEGMWAGQREEQSRTIRGVADEIPGLWDPPTLRKKEDPRAPPKTRGVLEPDVNVVSHDQPPVRRANQSMDSYEKELELWWNSKLASKHSNTEVFRQRADALKTKMSGPEPAARGPLPSVSDLDFLKADDPTVMKLKSDISILEKQTKELDVTGLKLNRADEYRKELLGQKKKKTDLPPLDWRVGLHRFSTYFLLPYVPPMYYMLQLNTKLQWKSWQLLPFLLLPLPIWAQASLAKARLQPWTKSDQNVTVEMFLTSAAGWMPPLAITYLERRRKVFALLSTIVSATCVGLFMPPLGSGPLQKQARDQVMRSAELLQPGQPQRGSRI